MSFARFSTDDVTGQDPRLRRRRALHRRSARNLRRRRRGRDSADAGAAALHLRERLRAPRRRQPAPRRAAAVTKPRPRYFGWEIYWHKVRSCHHGHRSRRRFRHAQRPRFDRRQRAGPAWLRRTAEYPSAPQERGSGPRHAEPRRSHGALWWRQRRSALQAAAGVPGSAVEAIALDTTGSSVIPVGEDLEPLDDYYLWCDHRAWREAALITALGARAEARSHRLVRRNLFVRVGLLEAAALAAATTPTSGTRMVTALEHCDMVAAVLCGITDPAEVPRASAPWATSGCGTLRWADCRLSRFLASVDPLLAGMREKLERPVRDLRRRWPGICRPVGGQARAARRDSDSGRRVRRPLGCDRRRRATRRRGERDRHVHVHHGNLRRDPSCARRLRRRARIRPSGNDRHRSRAVGDRRHLRSDRPARRHLGARLCPRDSMRTGRDRRACCA